MIFSTSKLAEKIAPHKKNRGQASNLSGSLPAMAQSLPMIRRDQRFFLFLTGIQPEVP